MHWLPGIQQPCVVLEEPNGQYDDERCSKEGTGKPNTLRESWKSTSCCLQGQSYSRIGISEILSININKLK